MIMTSSVRRVCLSGPVLRRRSMECNAALQVTSYNNYPGPFSTASDATRQRQSKSRLNPFIPELFETAGEPITLHGFMRSKLSTVNIVTAGTTCTASCQNKEISSDMKDCISFMRDRNL